MILNLGTREPLVTLYDKASAFPTSSRAKAIKRRAKSSELGPFLELLLYSRESPELLRRGEELISPRRPDEFEECTPLQQSPTPDVPEVLDVVVARRLNYLATSKSYL
ncbi:hypothetical protein F511_10610 [Dorcoceras hygrometricum]|uniref:Uncharacterized protein n=1 Tax=Dorcoceras hygrometricum TaxID=472368 RepID=A0A2Z7CJL5_9LAMI|nr:hypothetical protein F511_10610 [Dorcoceras hygrometricum]